MQACIVPARALVAFAGLIALAACSNTTSTSSADTVANTPRVAANNGAGGANSVNAVSDALGQRLDGMLTTRPASAPVGR